MIWIIRETKFNLESLYDLNLSIIRCLDIRDSKKFNLIQNNDIVLLSIFIFLFKVLKLLL